MCNKADPQTPHVAKVEAYDNNGYKIQDFITMKYDVTEKELPRLISTLGLIPDYKGHRHVQEFLESAQLGTPLLS